MWRIEAEGGGSDIVFRVGGEYCGVRVFVVCCLFVRSVCFVYCRLLLSGSECELKSADLSLIKLSGNLKL